MLIVLLCWQVHPAQLPKGTIPETSTEPEYDHKGRIRKIHDESTAGAEQDAKRASGSNRKVKACYMCGVFQGGFSDLVGDAFFRKRAGWSNRLVRPQV